MKQISQNMTYSRAGMATVTHTPHLAREVVEAIKILNNSICSHICPLLEKVAQLWY